ncbi:Uncharacterised protein [Mycobacteroides abscessus subsp. abscessus]|nr:Uncharacterised protein [Mycobacteroides abscessus subsp. abscessus]SHX05065.1 Uncharacterised protein [Mycobacteroides abscessus subsp. abscessus]SIA41671.1 Uncharacterised protein [Mycobacteroides abscessus subsp. abscessus]SIL00995.1 Uncharacterised protein [Mycobacteroides abscessus subsp. abscessus]SKL11910.1 Uncharacterised protein [Mycobacteroides abscessus subsp. abscessus]
MQGAADATGEAGTVQEDAGALVLACAPLLFPVELVLLEVALAAQPLLPELPVGVGELFDRIIQIRPVICVGQKGPM